MIEQTKVNGFDIRYAIFDPKKDRIYPAYLPGKTVREIAQMEKADAAINFNFANTTIGQPIGRLIVDGESVVDDISKTQRRDELYALPDGSLHIGRAPKGAVWSIQGSPPLLKGGKVVINEYIIRDNTGTDIWQRKALRTAVGLTDDRKLLIVRTMEALSLEDLAEIMKILGSIDSLNGDGGGSSYFYPADSGYGRKLGSALIVKKGADKMKPIGNEHPEVIIDAGHGGTDPGARGNGLIEKDLNLEISLYQYERFQQLGIPVAITRITDVTIDSTPRATMVKESGAKVCICNHNNSADAAAKGAEVIHSVFNDGKLANAFAEALKAAGQPVRRVFSRANDSGGDYYYMHRLTGSVTTLIVEYGFVTNTEDAATLKARWKDLAEAIVKEYCVYYGHAYTAPAGEAEKPVETIDGFTDIAGHWAITSLRKAIRKGVINGVSAALMAPDGNLTRAQGVVMLDRTGILDELPDKEVK